MNSCVYIYYCIQKYTCKCIYSIYFEGYADQLKESDLEKLQFEYAEYQAAMA